MLFLIKKSKIVSIFSIFWLIINVDQVLAIEYSKYITSAQQHVHIIKIDPKKYKMLLIGAHDIGLPSASLHEIAQHYSDTVVAIINGGFFRWISDKAVPVEVMQQYNIWYGISYKTRGAVGWSLNNNFLFDRLNTVTRVQVGDINYIVKSLNLLNKSLANRLFTKNYINVPIHVSSVEIGNYIYVPDLEPRQYSNWQVDVQVIPQLYPKNQDIWNKMDFILSGAPLLIVDGAVITDFSVEHIRDNFINLRHARTAIGIDDNNHWVWVVAEQLPWSPGLTIHELSTIMLDLNCKWALNLDGGRSTGMQVMGNNFGSVHTKLSNALILEKL